MDPEALAGRVDAEAVFVRALDELEILQLPAEEQQGWLEEYGIEELSRDPLISASYRTAGRISFFTVGDKEVRAWTIREGESAVEACLAPEAPAALPAPPGLAALGLRRGERERDGRGGAKGRAAPATAPPPPPPSP